MGFAAGGEAAGVGRSLSMSATLEYGSLADVTSAGSATFQVDAPGGFAIPFSGNLRDPSDHGSLGFGISASVGSFVGVTFDRWVRTTAATTGQRPNCSFVDAGLGAGSCR